MLFIYHEAQKHNSMKIGHTNLKLEKPYSYIDAHVKLISSKSMQTKGE